MSFEPIKFFFGETPDVWTRSFVSDIIFQNESKTEGNKLNDDFCGIKNARSNGILEVKFSVFDSF